jgi:hypothetical protein
MEARSRQPTAIRGTGKALAIVRHGKGARDCHGHRCVPSARGDTEDGAWNARDGGVQRASVSQWAPRSNCDLRDAHATSQCCLEYLFGERVSGSSVLCPWTCGRV